MVKFIDDDKLEMIAQGSEAKVYKVASEGKILKHRFEKQYRHPELDKKLRRRRTKAEFKRLQACAKLKIRVPQPLKMDPKSGQIVMEFIDAPTTKEFIDRQFAPDTKIYAKPAFELARLIGTIIAQLHSKDIIHGDLTTSNFLFLENEDPKIVIPIDFGLSAKTNKVEDKAVDLYVLERAFVSTHVESEGLVKVLFDSYRKFNPEETSNVMDRLEKVRMRGRKRSMIG